MSHCASKANAASTPLTEPGLRSRRNTAVTRVTPIRNDRRARSRSWVRVTRRDRIRAVGRGTFSLLADRGCAAGSFRMRRHGVAVMVACGPSNLCWRGSLTAGLPRRWPRRASGAHPSARVRGPPAAAGFLGLRPWRRVARTGAARGVCPSVATPSGRGNPAPRTRVYGGQVRSRARRRDVILRLHAARPGGSFPRSSSAAR